MTTSLTDPIPTPPVEMESFNQLDLSPIMLRALKRLNYTTPSPIQAQVIPVALDGFDIIGQARTGTGKTAAFGIPILELLDPITQCRNPQAMILVPTRELAEQVGQEIARLSFGCKTAITVLAGGKHLRKQMSQLQDGTQIVVGTPGRVYDHIKRQTFKTHDLWCIVLDEADRMLDIGFRPAIEKILRSCPKDRQTMLLSATLPAEIQRLTQRYLTEPVHINCSKTQVSVDAIEQRYISVRQTDKYSTLIKLLKRESPRQAIIFCRTKRGTDRLQRALFEDLRSVKQFHGKKIECIHGDMNQRDRDRVFTALRDGSIDILVATDVVGRGIDVSTVSHIINFDIPMDCDDYVHRVGRTGRMGREGIAFTFVTADEGPQLTAIELNINKLLQRDTVDVVIPEAPPTNLRSAPPEEVELVPPPSAAHQRKGVTVTYSETVGGQSSDQKRKRLFPKRKLTERLARLSKDDRS